MRYINSRFTYLLTYLLKDKRQYPYGNDINYYKMKQLSPAVCPFSVTAHCPVSADHIFNCVSAPPDSTTTPDGKKQHLYTSP